MLNFRLALRNVFSNTRRTIIMLAAIGFGAAALIVNGGLIHFIFEGLKEDAIHGRHGHIQIYRQGYRDSHEARPLEYALENAEYSRLASKLSASFPQVEDVSARLDFSGLIVKGGRNVSFLGLGVEPEKDHRFSSLIRIVEGSGLSPEEPYGVLLGKGLAAKAEVRAGDYITAMTTTAQGSYNAIDLRVRGVFQGGWKEIDDWLMKAPLATAQDLLRFPRVHKAVLLLEETGDTAAVAEGLEELFRREGMPLELATWSDLALFYNQVVDMFSKELNIVKLIISIVVILSIVNTVSMSVFERTREIGTILALGAKRRRMLALFFAEAAILGVAGGALGLLAGCGIALAVSQIGIPMPPPPGSTLPFTAEVELVPAILAYSFLIALASPLVATIYPAYKACRGSIADALRHI